MPRRSDDMNDGLEAFRLRRNPSYRSSVKTGLKLGLWLAPTTLLVAVGRPLKDAALGLVFAILRGTAWAIVTLSLIAAGLAGFVTPSKNNQG